MTTIDLENLMNAVRFGSAQPTDIVCPQCRTSGKVHRLASGVYECSNINKCKTVKYGEGCRFKVSADLLQRTQKVPTCTRCGDIDKVRNLGDEDYVCGSERCRSRTPTGGYKFTATTQTLLHGVSNIEEYFKAAELIFNHITASEQYCTKKVGSGKLMAACNINNRVSANRIRSTIYHAMQPGVLKQGLETRERCGLGCFEFGTDGIKGTVRNVKIFILCDMTAADFWPTTIHRKNHPTRFTKKLRPTTFHPSQIRLAFYDIDDDHGFVFRTHFLPASVRTIDEKYIRPKFMFFTPKKDEFNYYTGSTEEYTGFTYSSFKHWLYPNYRELTGMVKCIDEEKRKLGDALKIQKISYKDLGYFLCEYVFKRNIELKKETPTVEHLYQGLLTPMLPEGLHIRKDLAPGVGFPNSDNVIEPDSDEMPNDELVGAS